jgi:4a-hydroxytetrahydrobiopterin dehydratase
MDLINKKCVPCEGGTTPLEGQELDKYVAMVKLWLLAKDRKQISKEYIFANFVTALEFVNKVGALSESEGHHPDILVFGYNKVKITLSTHAILGLSENDFIMAVKIDELVKL